LQINGTHIDIHGAVYRVGHVFRCALPRRLRIAGANGPHQFAMFGDKLPVSAIDAMVVNASAFRPA
jgi:hypothetical protein